MPATALQRAAQSGRASARDLGQAARRDIRDVRTGAAGLSEDLAISRAIAAAEVAALVIVQEVIRIATHG